MQSGGFSLIIYRDIHYRYLGTPLGDTGSEVKFLVGQSLARPLLYEMDRTELTRKSVHLRFQLFGAMKHRSPHSNQIVSVITSQNTAPTLTLPLTQRSRKNDFRMPWCMALRRSEARRETTEKKLYTHSGKKLHSSHTERSSSVSSGRT